MAAIALVLERTRAGQGQALFVIGEAGLGKTSQAISNSQRSRNTG